MYYKLRCNSTQFVIYYKLRNNYKLQRNIAQIMVTMAILLDLYQLDMCLWNKDAPGGNKVKKWQKSLSPTFWLTPPQGHGMSVKCEEPIDELTVQVWLLYHHPNF